MHPPLSLTYKFTKTPAEHHSPPLSFKKPLCSFQSRQKSSHSVSMASISPPSPHKLTFSNPKFPSSSSPSLLRRSSCPSPFPSFPSYSQSICHCNSSDSPSPSDPSVPWRWDSALQDLIKTAIARIDSYLNPNKNVSKDASSNRSGASAREDEKGEEIKDEADASDRDWDWDRWRKHFDDVDEQERLVAVLKSRMSHAVFTEDYEDAARLKVAIAAVATNDTVGRVMSYLNRAIAEERYEDAAFMRDNAGAGLVGWWAGIPKDLNNPHGVIIQITPEHGRYVARSYSPRQLATAKAAAGVPLFEIFLTLNKKGEYKQQAVYLKQKGVFQDPSTVSSKLSDAPSILKPLDPTGEKGDLFLTGNGDALDDDDRNDDSDVALRIPVSQDIFRDMIPGVKVKVLKVTVPGKVDKDLISKVIEQIVEEEEEGEGDEEEEEDDDDDDDEEEEEKDSDFESIEADEEIKGDYQVRDEIELDADPGTIESEGRNEIAVKVVVGGLVQKLTSGFLTKDLLRVPAIVEKKGRLSFSFSIEKEANQRDFRGKERPSVDNKAKFRDQGIDHVMLDLAKVAGREKIPLKVLKDVSELINLTLSQAQNYQPLSGSTIFNRIEIPASSDPLDGLYIGAHGLYASEVIHLRRRFGQWKEDGRNKESPNLEFYEYVEALKITGDPYVPAGQVSFRAKVGKRYQLPHKGIIPEEFGVIARYKGQGRLAEPGFRNPQWVDGELVILDGKYIKGGPVVGFVYWAPEFHFLVFFNRLRLQE